MDGDTLTLEEARQQMIVHATGLIDRWREEAVEKAIAEINAGFIGRFPMRLHAFLAFRREREPGVIGPLDTYVEEQPIALLYAEWSEMERHLSEAPLH